MFSRSSFIWPELDRARAMVVAPSIDVFSAKNQDLAPATVDAILHAAGIAAGEAVGAPGFQREDGTPATVRRRATVVEIGR